MLRALAVLLLLMLAPLLAACGFEPLYAEHSRAGIESQLAAIKILPIREHVGQLLEWRLRNDFDPEGDSVPPAYALHVELALHQDFLATQIDAVATRGTIEGVATISLTTLDNKTVLYRGKIQSVADYNVVEDAYASQIGSASAQKRVIDDIGQEIETRLLLYLRDRTAAR
jgi:LPS-assembly lipoprotein